MSEDKPSCTCPTCAEMCKEPCYGTPSEMEAIEAAGYGKGLWITDWGGVPLVAPKYTRRIDLPLPGYWCVFAMCRSDLPGGVGCRLHDLGLKPEEARRVDHTTTGLQIREEIVARWGTPEGQQAVEVFQNSRRY